MATEDINIVDPDNGAGTDYTSLSLWEDGEDGQDLPTLDKIAVAKCRSSSGTADTTFVDFDGWTATDATRYIKIAGDTGHRASTSWSTSKYRFSVADGYLAYLRENYMLFDGVQIELSSATTSRILFGGVGLNAASSDIRFHSCHFQMPSTSSKTLFFAAVTGSLSIHFRNCILKSLSTNSDSYLSSQSDKNIYADNCTFIWNSSNTIGVRDDGGTCNIRNCYSGGTGTYDYYGTFDTKTTCASEDTTGSSGLTGIALSNDNFTNYTSNWSLPSTSDLVGVGTNLYSDFTTDIDGNTRPASAAWCIGAYEYVAAGGTTLPVYAYYYDHMRSQ